MGEKQSFADNIGQLEQIIKNMEEGKLSLEQMLEHYSKGVELLKECKVQLDDAVGKVEEYSKSLGGTEE